MNSMNVKMWEEMSDVFTKAGSDKDVRAIVLSGKGRMFTAGEIISWLMNGYIKKTEF